MKIMVKVVVALVVGFSMIASVCFAAGPMSNDDVIKLFMAGKSEALILSSIDSSESHFDTSADALINLKKAGVSDAIIQRMIEKKAYPISKPANTDPKVTTDKDVYQYGETIRVNYYNAPGLREDWITISPSGSSEKEDSEHQHLEKGMNEGALTFDCHDCFPPGNYEVRAYYNYRRNIYSVSARHNFSVVEGTIMQREIDTNNPLEANLPPGKGLVYILRETVWITKYIPAQIIADKKPIVDMKDATYFPFIVSAGEVHFTAISNEASDAEKTLQIKPGLVYYLKVRMIPVPSYKLFLYHLPHLEGAMEIKGYKLLK